MISEEPIAQVHGRGLLTSETREFLKDHADAKSHLVKTLMKSELFDQIAKAEQDNGKPAWQQLLEAIYLTSSQIIDRNQRIFRAEFIAAKYRFKTKDQINIEESLS